MVIFLPLLALIPGAFLPLQADFFDQINDHPGTVLHSVPSNSYHQFCRNIYSQNGEDGIIEQLFLELGIEQGTFCEFGAADGIYSSNTYHLIEKGFSGLAIEPDHALYAQCVERYAPYPVQVEHGFVLSESEEYSLDAWLSRAGLPVDFDILSIDIDSDDYYVWEKLTNFFPKIVIIETNSYRDPFVDELPGVPTTDYVVDPLMQWHRERVAVGCSFMSAVKLALRKGYVPVAYTGNLISVRKDLVGMLRLFPWFISDNPYDYMPLYTHRVLWGNTWKTNTGLIFNRAIGDYFTLFGTKSIDSDWLESRMTQIMAGTP
jgi:hypothetical protein